MNLYPFLNYQEIPYCPVCKEAGTDTVGNVKLEDSRMFECPNCESTWMEFDEEGKVSREMMLYWRPMCAGTYREDKHKAFFTDDRHIIERKENGDRVIAVYSGETAQFFTRTLSRADDLPVEKTEWLPHLQTKTDASFILDGEIEVRRNSDHTQVNSIFNCELSKSLQRQKERGKLIFVVFDCLMYNGEDIRELPLSERLEFRGDAVKEVQSRLFGQQRGLLAPKARVVRTVTSGEGEQFVNDLLARGDEGAMIKDLSSAYYSDQRPEAWLKIKEQEEVDLFIIGYKEARATSTKVDGSVSKTKYAGQIGSIELGAYDKKLGEVSICFSSGIPDELRLDISKHQKEYLRQVVQVKCQRVTKDQKGNISLQNPRVQMLREDKNWKACLFSDIEAAYKKKAR